MGSSFDSIKINCDLGEGFENDAALMPYLHSCSIACGGHYGDAESMRSTIELALQHGVKVGAHPSFPDRENFGRDEMLIDLDELELSLRQQVNSFNSACLSLSTEMHHIKLHGALYNLAAKDESIASAILRAFNDFPRVSLYTPFKSVLGQLAEPSRNVCFEAFIDRTYEDDGSLVNRSEDNALISSPTEAWMQMESIVTLNKAASVHGVIIPIHADTFCIHGDNENALTILDYVQYKISLNV